MWVVKNGRIITLLESSLELQVLKQLAILNSKIDPERQLT
jgi:hypothetical protein